MKRIEDVKRILYFGNTYKVLRISGSSFIVLCLENRLVTHLSFRWVEKAHAEGLAEIGF